MKHRLMITIDDESLELFRAAAAYIKSTSLNAWMVPTLVAAARTTLKDAPEQFEENGAADELPVEPVENSRFGGPIKT